MGGKVPTQKEQRLVRCKIFWVSDAKPRVKISKYELSEKSHMQHGFFPSECLKAYVFIFTFVPQKRLLVSTGLRIFPCSAICNPTLWRYVGRAVVFSWLPQTMASMMFLRPDLLLAIHRALEAAAALFCSHGVAVAILMFLDLSGQWDQYALSSQRPKSPRERLSMYWTGWKSFCIDVELCRNRTARQVARNASLSASEFQETLKKTEPIITLDN